MSDDMIEETLERHRSLYQATDAVLDEWTGDGNLQFPVLLGMMAVKLNWDEKQVRENDPFVRFYVRQHKKWHVTRGAHGGIMRKEIQEKKDASKLEKDLIKKQVREAIDAKIAKLSPDSAPSDVEDDSDSD